MSASDPHDLQRFVDAQAPVIERARAELRDGRKRSHWMWFVFPQIQGLGSSSTARHFAIASQAEAEAYLAHPVLGPRLRECTNLALGVTGRSAHDIFGSPDDLKFRSCLTLFAAVAEADSVFTQGLRRYFGGAADPRTVDALTAERA